MTRSQILELAKVMTERKGEPVLDYNSIFAFVCQDMCKRQRFWWRRIEFSFTVTLGTQTYDLTQITTTPANVLAETAIEEITKFVIVTASSPFQFAELVPVFDPLALVYMINNTYPTSPNGSFTPNSIQAGGRYTMDANDYKILRIDPPDNNYTAYVVGWAMPNPATGDNATDTVPLIPPWGHNTIVDGMKSYIFDWAYGAENPKAMKAQQRYEQGIQDLAMRQKFDPNYKLMANLSSDGAIRST